MDYGVYLKHGWDENKSFTVKEYQGVFKRENNNEKDL